ncbi:hypothetical protein HBB16_17015 [Pseudonocardia sp. MCCB 268]|nr:hypothetical protein [Pseudonocardia cytotoxica]
MLPAAAPPPRRARRRPVLLGDRPPGHGTAVLPTRVGPRGRRRRPGPGAVRTLRHRVQPGLRRGPARLHRRPRGPSTTPASPPTPGRSPRTGWPSSELAGGTSSGGLRVQ